MSGADLGSYATFRDPEDRVSSRVTPHPLERRPVWKWRYVIITSLVGLAALVLVTIGLVIAHGRSRGGSPNDAHKGTATLEQPHIWLQTECTPCSAACGKQGVQSCRTRCWHAFLNLPVDGRYCDLSTRPETEDIVCADYHPACHNTTLLGPQPWYTGTGGEPVMVRGSQRWTNGTAFRVWAPHADPSKAYVQQVASAAPITWGKVQMVFDTMSGTFYANVPGAAAGDLYVYTFNDAGTPGSQLTRFDPRAQGINTNPATGKWNASIIQDNYYPWKTAQPPVYKANEIVVYEMHIPSFNVPSGQSQGNFTSAAEKLPYLAQLGINVIEILPCMEFPGGSTGWGYNPGAPYAPMQAFGGSTGLKQFVDTANGLGIAVWLDVVFNHMGTPNVLTLYDGADINNNGLGIYFFGGNKGETPWGPRLNFVDSNVNTYITDNLQMWMNDYHISGFRWDSTICIRQGGQTGVPCWNAQTDIPSGWQLMQNGSKVVHSHDPPGLLVAEDTKNFLAVTLPTNDTSVGVPNAPGGAGFDGQWGEMFYYSYVPATLVIESNGAIDMNAYASLIGDTDGEDPHQVLYTENHDKASNQQKGRIPMIVDPAGSASNPDFWAAKKALQGIATLLTTTGIPMMFYGMEFLTYQPFTFPSPPSINWTLPEANAGFLSCVSQLVKLRTATSGASAGLTGPNVDILSVIDGANDKVAVFRRTTQSDSDPDVLVLQNYRDAIYTAFQLTNVPNDGTYDVIMNTDDKKCFPSFDGYGVGQAPVVVSGGRGTVQVPAYATLILSQQTSSS